MKKNTNFVLAFLRSQKSMTFSLLFEKRMGSINRNGVYFSGILIRYYYRG